MNPLQRPSPHQDTPSRIHTSTFTGTMKHSSNKTQMSKGTKKGEPSAGTPIFLRKTYDMLNKCDNSIASWYDDGKTFVVKDTDRFATEVIPDYFKHNNFSSFVRQLNFYGFRKIKSGSLRIKDAETSEECKYWKFRHEKFQRGRPDLLSQIRKNSSETADKQEVEQLKCEIKDLRCALNSVTDDLANLKALVGCLVTSKDVPVQQSLLYYPEAASKKRKALVGEYLGQVQSDSSILQNSELSEPYSNTTDTNWMDMKGMQAEIANHQLQPNGMSTALPTPITSLTPLPTIRSNCAVENINHNMHLMYGDAYGHKEWMDDAPIPPAVTTSHRASMEATSLDEDVLASLLVLDDDDEDDMTFFEELGSCSSGKQHI